MTGMSLRVNRKRVERTITKLFSKGKGRNWEVDQEVRLKKFCLAFIRWEKSYHVSSLMRKNPVQK